MTRIVYRGFAGVRLEGDARGPEDAPPVLILPGLAQTRQEWAGIAAALSMAGRRVIALDLRGHGSSEWPSDGRYGFDAFVEDIKAVLAQMTVRPVIVAGSLGGWSACAALAEAGTHLAAGLVLIDELPADMAAAPSVGALLARAGLPRIAPDRDPRLLDALQLSGLDDRLAAAAARLALPALAVGGGAAVTGFAAAIPHVEHAETGAAIDLAGDDGVEALSAALLDFLERRLPLAAPEFREGSDARTFRDALGCFATGVTVVTAMAGGEGGQGGAPIGLTANSFTSVSLDPPLLLVCIANSAGSATVLESADRFAVNVLQIGQQPTSNRFAGKGEDRFAATPWEVGEFGTPVLTGSLASFECARHAVHEGGDHFLLVGRVLKARFEPRRDPLLYFRGRYRRLHFA